MPSVLKNPVTWLSVIYAAAAFVVMYHLASDFRMGGSEWKQADWLINNTEVFVRRGLLGSVLIGASDLAGISLLSTITALQAGLFLATVLVTVSAAVRQGVSVRLLAVLTVSGGFVLFWASDIHGSLRKELFVFLSLALLAHGATFPRLPTLHLVLSLALVVVGISAHEGLIFFMPLYAAALYFAWGGGMEPRKLSVIAGLAVVILAVFAFNLLQPRLDSVDPVCRPLLDRGFDPVFCIGAIKALTHTLGDEMGEAMLILKSNGIFYMAFAFGLCSLPFALYLYDGRNTRWRIAALLVVVGLPFLPLYIVAIDWGRWVSFHVTGAMYLLMILRARGLAPESKLPLPFWVVPVLVAVSVSLCFAHMEAKPTSGAFKELIELVVR